MNMIGHHDVGVNRTLRTATRVVDHVSVGAEIQPIAEDRAAIGPAVDDVKRYYLVMQLVDGAEHHVLQALP